MKFTRKNTGEYFQEWLRVIRLIQRSDVIFKTCLKYIASGKSLLTFLDKFSVEQVEYITHSNLVDNKLIACAGSGKTTSIIGRVKFMVEHGLIHKNEVFAITFSRPAATDFHRKIRLLFPNHASFCELKNFSTIDSLAKSILCRVKSHKSDNVEILSIAFKNYLSTISSEDITLVRRFKNIKYLFVDEAQDLNAVQFGAIMLLREKFGTIVSLIGDPNQNIYQFRRSSATYLMNFPCK
jgi:superfamily I DNA/RNA helicase